MMKKVMIAAMFVVAVFVLCGCGKTGVPETFTARIGNKDYPAVMK